jgi:hypothetical protein
MFRRGATGFYGIKAGQPSRGEKQFIGDSDDGFYQWDTNKADSATVTLTNNTTKLNGAVTAINDIVIAADTTMLIDEASTLKVKEGVTFTVAGTLNVVNSGTVKLTSGNDDITGAKFVLKGGTGSTGDESRGGKLTGDGKVVAGATEIVGGKGGWQAVGAGTITIKVGETANANEATITATPGTSGTPSSVLTAGAGAIITQTAKDDNSLTVAAATEIALGRGPNDTAVGKLILAGLANNPGEIKLAHRSTSIVSAGKTAISVPFGTAAKIGDKIFAGSANGTASVYTTTAPGNTPGKFAKLSGDGDTANSGLKGGDASNTITIDASQDVTAAE